MSVIDISKYVKSIAISGADKWTSVIYIGINVQA